MSRRGIVALVAGVEASEGVLHMASLSLAASAPSGARLKLRDGEHERTFTIRRDPYFDLHMEIAKSRTDQSVYVEPEDEDEQVVARLLIPQARRIAEVRV